MSNEITDKDLGLDELGPSNAGLQQRSYKNLNIQQASKELIKEKKLERVQMSMRKIPKNDNTGQKIIQVRLEFDKMKQKAEEIGKEIEKKGINEERVHQDRKNKVESLNSQIEQVKSALAAEKESVALQKAKIDEDHQSVLTELSTELAHEQEEAITLKATIEKLSTTLTSSEEGEDAETRKKREISELEESESKYKTKIKTIAEKNNALNDALAKNVDLLGKLQEQVSKSNQDDGKQQELTDLKTKQSNLQSQVDDLLESEKSLKLQISQNEIHLADLSKKILTLKTNKKIAQEELDTYQNQLEKVSKPVELVQPVKVEPLKVETKIQPVIVKSNEPEYLTKLKNNDKSLTELKLSNKGISDHEVTEISHALVKNTHLKVLDLSNNSKITGANMNDIIDMIKANKTLEELNFEECPVSRKALDLLLSNLTHNTTLTQVFGGQNETDKDIEMIDEIMDRNVDLANN